MSRKISDLQDPFFSSAKLFIAECEKEGLQVLIYCTKRTFEEQARLFRQGRSLQEIQNKAVELKQVYKRPDLAEILLNVGPQKGNRVVTWAGPGQSLHNYAYAFDGCPTREGKPVWGTKDPDDLALWMKYGEIAKRLGLVWAGDWSAAKREFPHVQQPNVKWQDLIRLTPLGV